MHLSEVFAQAELRGVVADYPGAPKICFPIVEHRTEIGEDDVIVGYCSIRRVYLVRLERIRSRPHYALVPVTRNTKAFGREFADRQGCLAVAHAGPKDIGFGHNVEQFDGLFVRLQEPGPPFVLTEDLCLARPWQGPADPKVVVARHAQSLMRGSAMA
jgi:hypothetical protein